MNAIAKRIILITVFVAGLGIAIAYLGRPLRELVRVVWFVNGIKMDFRKTDKKIASIPDHRLDKLIHDCELAASKMTNEQTYTRDDKNIPAEFTDLNPSWVYITTDKVMIEFMGGFAHNGIVARKSDSGTWSLYHYNDGPKETRIK